LQAVADDFAAGGRREFAQFGQRIARVGAIARFEFDTDEEDPFRPRFSGYNQGFQRLGTIPQTRAPAPQRALHFIPAGLCFAP